MLQHILKAGGIDISWNQDSFVPNLRLGYWDVSYAMVKENVELKMTSNAGLNAEAGQKSSGTGEKVTPPGVSSVAGGNASNTIVMKTGPQINGYTKDVLTSPKFNQNTAEAVKAISSRGQEKKKQK